LQNKDSSKKPENNSQNKMPPSFQPRGGAADKRPPANLKSVKVGGNHVQITPSEKIRRISQKHDAKVAPKIDNSNPIDNFRKKGVSPRPTMQHNAKRYDIANNKNAGRRVIVSDNQAHPQQAHHLGQLAQKTNRKPSALDQYNTAITQNIQPQHENNRGPNIHDKLHPFTSVSHIPVNHSNPRSVPSSGKSTLGDPSKLAQLDKSLKPKKKRSIGKTVAKTFALLLVIVLGAAGILAYNVYNTYNEVVASIRHDNVLSDEPDDGTGATVYLIAGNDGRSLESETDVMGARSDTIILLIHSALGHDTLLSIPRDTMVRIPTFIDTQGLFGLPGTTIPQHMNKINASYSYGGAKLLIRTVEMLTDLKVDHYIEVGFDGVAGIVDDLGGINLCFDSNVNDPDSGMQWVSGCHDVDGGQALAFSRMRHQDPLGDLGRALRQQQVINRVASKVQQTVDEANLSNLFNYTILVDTGENALQFVTFDENMGIWDIKDLALQFKSASANQSRETSFIPIEDDNDYDEDLGSVVTVNGDKVRLFLHNLAVS
jgi:LCP family protein required for cell wall assembly